MNYGRPKTEQSIKMCECLCRGMLVCRSYLQDTLPDACLHPLALLREHHLLVRADVVNVAGHNLRENLELRELVAMAGRMHALRPQCAIRRDRGVCLEVARLGSNHLGKLGELILWYFVVQVVDLEARDALDLHQLVCEVALNLPSSNGTLTVERRVLLRRMCQVLAQVRPGDFLHGQDAIEITAMAPGTFGSAGLALLAAFGNDVISPRHLRNNI